MSLTSALFLAAAPSLACSWMASTEPEKVQVRKSYTSSGAIFIRKFSSKGAFLIADHRNSANGPATAK